MYITVDEDSTEKCWNHIPDKFLKKDTKPRKGEHYVMKGDVMKVLKAFPLPKYLWGLKNNQRRSCDVDVDIGTDFDIQVLVPVTLPKGTIKLLIGRDMTFDEAPLLINFLKNET